MNICIDGDEYEIVKNLEKNTSSEALYKVKRNENFYILRIFKNLSKMQIEILQKEVNILSSLNKSFIERYLDLIKQNEEYYVLSEFCEDSNLKQFIDEHKGKNDLIEEEIIFDIISQICIALKVIHDVGIMHFNLKPENIYINNNNKIKICNFGISKIIENYNCPLNSKNFSEDISNDKINNKNNIWDLGLIIYELFTLNSFIKSSSNIKNESDEKNIIENLSKINIKKYNSKWKNLIGNMLKINFEERPDINQIFNFLINELEENKEIKEEDFDEFSTYEGEYLYGKKNGRGKIYYKKCDKRKIQFEGEFLNGNMWKGKIYNPNGDLTFEGEYLGEDGLNFFRNIWNGKGDLELKNNWENIIFNGEIINGKINGKVKEYYDIGKLKFECEYLNGEKYGKVKEYNEEGFLQFEGEYLNGKKNGKVKEYYYNKYKEYIGQFVWQFEGEYLNGEKYNGIIKKFYDNMNLRMETKYLKAKIL